MQAVFHFKKSFQSYIERTMAVQERPFHTATSKDLFNIFKKTTNPNVSPIGKRFGLECFGADSRT